jgi:hypothetical protein
MSLKNDSILTSYTHVFSCNAYMIIAITKWPMKNCMNVYVKLDLWCMMLTIYIFGITHNIQLGYDYNYVNLITYLHHMEKLHILNINWWTLIFQIIS